MKCFKYICWVVMFVAVFSVRPALADQFLANSIVINMGVTPQTVNNGVKPYGLVDALIDGNIPVYWAIDNAKSKDGVDFLVGATSFRGGSFVIPSEFATQAASIVATWTAQGVVVFNAPVDFVAPANGQAQLLNYIPLAVGTASIINTLFYNQSGISKIRLNGRPFVDQTADQGGGGLGRCEDVIAMPHEDPHFWSQSERDRMACFIDNDNSEGHAATCNNVWSGTGGIGGNYTRTNKGYMWAACHSVSAIEGPSGSGGYLGFNFLTKNAMIPWESGAHNNSNTPPFTYPSSQVPAVGNINSENVMQFMSTLDGALNGGSEEIYQPDAQGWRDESIIGVHDPDHSSVPEEAALVAFGYGYGDPDNGYLVYEASHNLNSGNVQENVAAARVYGNFLLRAGLELAPRVDQVSIDGIVVSGSGQIVTGSSNQLFVQATGGDESFYAYSWADTCGGSFSNTTIEDPIYNAPAAAADCSITVEVSDACGRSTFSAIPISISNDNLELTKAGDAQACPGDIITYDLTPSLVDSTVPIDTLCVFDSAPAGTTLNSTIPPQTSAGEWCLGSTVPGTDGVDPGAPFSAGGTQVFEWGGSDDTYIRDNSLNENNGTQSETYVYHDNGEEWLTLVRFDEPAGLDAAITANGTITAAQFRMYSTNNKGGTVNVRDMVTDWNEDNATWNDPNGGAAGDWVSGTFSPSDYSASNLGNISGATKNSYTSLSSGALVNLTSDWQQGTQPNFGFALRKSTANSSNDNYFATKESGSGTRPRLATTVTSASTARDPGSTVSLSTDTNLLVDSGVVTMFMDITLQHYAGNTVVTPPSSGSLLQNVVGSVTVNSCSGPSPANATFLNANASSSQTETFSYTCSITAPTNSVPNSISWSTPAGGGGFTVAGDSGVTFVQATSSSVLVTPTLQLLVNVTATAPGAITNTATIDDDIQNLVTSNQVTTNLPESCNVVIDYGDAPSSYGDADHVIGSSLYIGAVAPDSEPGSQYSPGADGDEDGIDDEDGVVFSALVNGGFAEVTAAVLVANGTGSDARICAWLDRWDSVGAVDGIFNELIDASSNASRCQDVATNGGTPSNYTFIWDNLPEAAGTTYARFRVCSTNSECNRPFKASPASDGEVEDYALPFDLTPTAVTIGSITLHSLAVTGFLQQLSAEQMSNDQLLAMLAIWDPLTAATMELTDDAATFIAALQNFLDPDGDGNVAVLEWDTIEERGTIGFYVERLDGDVWIRINNDMLPGLINAPMGGEYRLADPAAKSGNSYQYQLIEQEATGSVKFYGPFDLEME